MHTNSMDTFFMKQRREKKFIILFKHIFFYIKLNEVERPLTVRKQLVY